VRVLLPSAHSLSTPFPPPPQLTPFPGQDLHGNTFWEFRDSLSAQQQRMRRIVQYRSLAFHSDVEVSPQWHQWLRHTRRHPPSLDEQARDVARQQELKVLAAQADARWVAKRSVLDASPAASASAPALGEGRGKQGAEEGTEERPGGTEDRQDPWKQARRNPGEDWQPQPWAGTPAAATRRA
jgi:NADH dehydrogenase [ubiquinone] 1 alpha subcomplex assembly factor 2